MSTDPQSINWYNENAQDYTDHVRDPKNSLFHSYYEKPAMYSLLPDLKNKTVISLGCGSGEDSNHLKSLGAEKSVGIDISSGLVDIATSTYPECEFSVMDMEKLSFEDESFDFAYSSLAIHYIEDWTNIFKEVYRILKPNSYFLFSCNHPVKHSMEKIEEGDFKISRLEIKRIKNTENTEITGNYLNRKKTKDALGKDTVTTWHKPIGEISSEARAAGFLIDLIVEPRPIEDLNEISPRLYEKLNKIPEFVIFRLIKI